MSQKSSNTGKSGSSCEEDAIANAVLKAVGADMEIIKDSLREMWLQWKDLNATIRDNICSSDPVTTTAAPVTDPVTTSAAPVTDPVTTSTAAPNGSCASGVSICVAVDSTSNTNNEDYDRELEFVRALAALRNIGLGNDEFGMMAYAWQFEHGFDVSAHRTNADVDAAIASTMRIQGNTFLSEALLRLQTCTETAAFGNRIVGILLADSPTEGDHLDAQSKADEFRSWSGSELWTVAVGYADYDAMALMADSPSKSYYKSSYSELTAEFAKELSLQMCSA